LDDRIVLATTSRRGHNGPFSYTWAAGNAKKGMHILTVKVVDAVGNSISRSMKIVVH
jgi:hypothetical protein